MELTQVREEEMRKSFQEMAKKQEKLLSQKALKQQEEALIKKVLKEYLISERENSLEYKENKIKTLKNTFKLKEEQIKSISSSDIDETKLAEKEKEIIKGVLR